MASAAPAKIILKSSTKVSLNDRFTNIMKTRPISAVTVRAQVATERLASEKNRRLAQQMERRPAVAAELDGKRQPIQDRLGGRVTRGRGGFNRGLSRGFRGQGRGSTFSRLGRGQSRNLRGGTFQTRGTINRGRGNQRGRGFTRGNRFNRGRGASGRGRGRGRGRGTRGRGNSSQTTEVDRDALDEQLDSYMSKTKGSMDAELDSYMAEING